MSNKIGRNAPCPCGSGKKYKHCCIDRQQGFSLPQKLLMGFLLLVLVSGSLAAFYQYRHSSEGPGRVWSEEHQHWHPAP